MKLIGNIYGLEISKAEIMADHGEDFNDNEK